MNNSRVYRTHFIVGLPVPPKQFYGRLEQVRQFYGQCILGPVLQPTRILGLRRSGKTSFLNYISDSDVKKQFLGETIAAATKFVYINAQSLHSCDEFYNTVASAINEQLATSSEAMPDFKTGRAFRKWFENMLRTTAYGMKIIVLIDEFEKLHDSGEFEVEFFGLLRSLASAHPESFTWVTASAVDLYTLDKTQKTSPFWNIFHQTPIIMGGFSKEEVQSLIMDSLALIDESLIKRETEEIIILAGTIPYFVQSVADCWYRLRENQKLSATRSAVFNELGKPSNQIQHVYEGYWNDMGEIRRAILKNIASERRFIESSFHDLCTLTDFGLIISDNKHGKYKISGLLFKQFIIDAESNTGPLSIDLPKETLQKNETKLIVVEKDTHINTGGGNYFQGDTNTGGGNIMRNNYSNTGIKAEEISALFESIHNAIKTKPGLSESAKNDLSAEVEEVKEAFCENKKPDEKFLLRRLRNIGRIAPDILEVTLATIANPAAGLGIVAKKIANKIKNSEN